MGNLKTIFGYFGLAVLLSVGVMIIIISSAHEKSWWPSLTIFINVFAAFQIMVCGQATRRRDVLGGGHSVMDSLPWLFFGILVSFTWGFPVLAYRTGTLSATATYMTISGCTIIQTAILIFGYMFYFQKNSFAI